MGAFAGHSYNIAWRHLTAEQRKLILEGDPENDFDGSERFFHLVGAQEIQIARARFSQSISRVCHVPGMQWNAVAR